MKNLIQLFTAFSFLTMTMYAQNPQDAIKELERTANAKITINESLNIAEFIRFPSHNPLEVSGSTIQEKTFSFLETYKRIFALNSPANESFTVKSVKTDNFGFQHVSLQQIHNGIPIYDGTLRFHFNNESKLTSVNGNFIPNIKLNAIPNISEAIANSVATQTIEGQDINKSGAPLYINKNTLYVFQKGLAQGHYTTRHLVYEVEVRNNLDVREFVFVDAHSGIVVEQFTGMAHALDRIVYENNEGNIVWQEGDAFPGSLTIWQRNEVEASAHMYNFFNNAFGYQSYDGADITMRTINNNPGISCPNANWNGSTANYCDGTASDDVIAHEWGHAYTEYTSGLIYSYQSGAMNESYSDIWGETIDILNNYEDADDDVSLRTGCNSSDRWMIGEDATAFGSAIRDMWNPPCKGDPGKVTDGNYWCSTGDSGGVHINSGIPNHAYALLVDGGTYNGQTITGLGFTKAAHIFWRAQETYLTATSDFAVLADALESSCTDLIGINLQGLSTTSTPAGPSGEIITIADYNQLVNTLLAVELRINPDACGFEPILDATPDLCGAATTNAVFMEDWESGTGSWTITEIPTNPSTWDSRPWVIETNSPDSWPSQSIFAANPVNGDCRSDLENGIIRLQSPEIILPDYDEGTFEMAFDHYVATEPDWDGGNMKYSINGLDWFVLPSDAFLFNAYNGAINGGENDNPMPGEPAFTGVDGGSSSGSWGKSVIDLSAIGLGANDSAWFRWELGSDGCNGRIGWYLDNIVIYNCARPLSVEEFETLNRSIIVFPNPSNGVFTLSKTQQIDLKTAEIHDINGRFIKHIDLSTMSLEQNIDMTNLSSGIYFMTVNSIHAKTVIKLVKK
ncbi:M4 family metallopeptidase [Lacinutrix iliipiscaria]|uniref:M4 family metallopeptidase n=1 Tax=Lacinutrix iliipiscaria TaxID=1230532 RepID=A0ABW5WPP3_9FLAO